MTNESNPAKAGDVAMDAFLSDVRAELARARAKFPGDRIMTIALAEEFGELAKAVLDEPAANVRKEAVQCAVMAARVALDGDGSVVEWRAAKGLDQITAAPVMGDKSPGVSDQGGVTDGLSHNYPECSGDPACCPENEGYGCCKPNNTPPPQSDTNADGGVTAALNPLAIEALTIHQKQIDEHGEMVGVSRQALDELLKWYERARAALPSGEAWTHWEKFFSRYGLPNLTNPSCFGCGHAKQERATTHAELPNIYLCAECAAKIGNSSNAQGDDVPVAYGIRTDSGCWLDKIAPTNWARFDQLRAKMEADPWVANGKAAITPLFERPQSSSAGAWDALDLVKRAAFYGWQHANWEWPNVAIGCEEAAPEFPFKAAPQPAKEVGDE